MPQLKDGMIQALIDYKDVFAWSYDDMPGLSTELVAHKLPTDPAFPPVKQKLRKFKTDVSIKIKEEIMKQLEAKVIRVCVAIPCGYPILFPYQRKMAKFECVLITVI